MQGDPAEHGDRPHIGAHLPAAAGALRLRVAVPRRLHPHPLLLHRGLHVHVPREPTRLRTGEMFAEIPCIIFALWVICSKCMVGHMIHLTYKVGQIISTTYHNSFLGCLRGEEERPPEQAAEHPRRLRDPPRGRPRLNGVESLRIWRCELQGYHFGQ